MMTDNFGISVGYYFFGNFGGDLLTIFLGIILAIFLMIFDDFLTMFWWSYFFNDFFHIFNNFLDALKLFLFSQS